jgi:hypothetical protein
MIRRENKKQVPLDWDVREFAPLEEGRLGYGE